jgi:hypothetical protein
MSEDLYDLSMIFKLTTGDSILCQVLSDTENNIIIRDPIKINNVIVPSTEGIRVSTFYSKWFQGTDSRVHMIRKQHILSAAIPDELTKEDYIRIVDEQIDQAIEKQSNTNKKSTKNSNSWVDNMNFKLDSEQDRFKN